MKRVTDEISPPVKVEDIFAFAHYAWISETGWLAAEHNVVNCCKVCKCCKVLQMLQSFANVAKFCKCVKVLQMLQSFANVAKFCKCCIMFLQNCFLMLCIILLHIVAKCCIELLQNDYVA